jgi:RHS repeat-associated protein
LGSTTALVDSTGTVQTSYTFEPFGNTATTGSGTTNSFAYTGRELDAGNYYRARYYNPQLQRFVSEDPIGFRGRDTNFYAYAENNAISYRDPSGELLIGVVVGGVVGGVEAVIGARLQGESGLGLIEAGILGAGLGAGLGLFDPTEGALTIGELGLLGLDAGLAGDIAGQLLAIHGNPCKSFSTGQALGAGVGGGIAAVTGGVTAVAAESVGAGELAQGLLGAGASAVPATIGGPVGGLLGGRKDGCKE